MIAVTRSNEIEPILDICLVGHAPRLLREIPDDVYRLTEAFMPGPLSLVLPKRNIPDLVTSGHSTVAIRVPSHPLSRELLEVFGGPLAAPSANPFGFVSPTTAQHVKDQLGKKIDYILDGGDCQVGLESTIIEYQKGKAVVLRLGGLAIEEIEEVLGHRIEKILSSSSNPKAPGMLSAHYSPGVPLVFGRIDQLLDEHLGKKIGIICLKSNEEWRNKSVQIEELSSSFDLKEAARNIFKALRKMRDYDVEIVLAEEMPENFLGRAINDRLRRASVQ